MKVEVWSDFACPFCYIGKRRFEQGLSKFAHKENVEVIFKSYQLDPHSPKVVDKDIYTVLSEKQGVSYDQAKGFTQQIVQQAKELGLDYNFDSMILTNTFAAHRLSHYAKQQGKMYEMMERILKAFFTESLNISDYDVLTQLAVEVGLDSSEVKSILDEGKFADDVQQDMQQASQIGVRGVPFFVFNQKYAVSGAQAGETFLEVLEKVWQEENGQQPLHVLNPSDDESKGDNCNDGACNI